MKWGVISGMPSNAVVLMPKRGKILLEAFDVINRERRGQYGDPEDSFPVIARFWSTYINGRYGTDIELTRKDVALLMVLFKIAREVHGYKDDNFRDAGGYLGIGSDFKDE